MTMERNINGIIKIRNLYISFFFLRISIQERIEDKKGECKE